MTQPNVQAYKQARWRTRIQRAGILMLIVLSVIFISILYLNISAQAASAGMQIQSMQIIKQALLRSIASNRTDLAIILASSQMQKRAEALGYKPIPTDRTVYVMVPGYMGRQGANMAPPPSSDMLPQPLIKPGFTQSLWEVIFQQPDPVVTSTGGKLP